MKMYKTADLQVAKTSLTAALDAVGGQLNALATLSQEKDPNIH